MSQQTGPAIPPPFLPDEQQHRRQMAEWIREAAQGHLANTGELTLTTGTSTVVTDLRAGGASVVLLSPLTPTAAADLATLYVSARSKQVFTLTHAAGSANRTFAYALLG